MAYNGYQFDLDPLGSASDASADGAYRNHSSTLEPPIAKDMSSGAQPSYRSGPNSPFPGLAGTGPAGPTV